MRRPTLLLTVLAGALALGACEGGLLDNGGPPAHLRIAGADARRGAALIAAHGCGTCHVVPGLRGFQGVAGPPLTDWAQRTLIAGRFPNSPTRLVPWLVNAPAMLPGTGMPNLGVGEAEARHMAAYLYTLGAAGAAVYPPDPPLEGPSPPGLTTLDRIERTTAPLALGAARP